MKTLVISILFAAYFFAAPLTAQNYTLEFDIVNNTGLSLYGVYVTDTSQNNWGDDLIPEDRFEDGTTVQVSIPVDDQTLCDYDIKVEDDAQNYVQFTNVDFCVLHTLTFLMGDDGKLYFTVE